MIEFGMLPLSAYTPGQGDPEMEGKRETSTGAPVYTYEDYLANPGKVPYVTGATSDKKLIGTTGTRTIGGALVPVKLTDYGPGVKGIDIASSNADWATNFPYQGHTEATASSPLVNPTITAQPGQSVWNAPQGTAGAQGTSAGAMGLYDPTAAYGAAPSTTDKVIGGIGGALATAAKSFGQSQGASKSDPLAMLKGNKSGALDAILRQMNPSAGYGPPPTPVAAPDFLSILQQYARGG